MVIHTECMPSDNGDEHYRCLNCGASCGPKQVNNHATYHRSWVFLGWLVRTLTQSMPMNSVTINRRADAEGVSRHSMEHQRSRLVEEGILVHDFYPELAEANDLPTTLAHFWRLGSRQPLSDEAALAAMRGVRRT